MRDHAHLNAIVDRLIPGEDFGIVHKKGCREKLASEQEQRDSFQGPGNCPACKSKADLRLPGAEKIVVGMECMFGEPAVATDLMEAAQGIDYTWIAFRVPIIDTETGAVIGHGLGARSLAESAGNTNTMLKMGKKSAIIDGVKTTFALSGQFTQDASHEDEPRPAAPATAPATAAAPTPAPPRPGPPSTPPAAPPAPPPGGLTVERKAAILAANSADADPNETRMLLQRLWEFYDLPKAKIKALYVIAGYRDGDTITPQLDNKVYCMLQHDLHKWVVGKDMTTKTITGWTAQQRQDFVFDRWLETLTSASAATAQ